MTSAFNNRVVRVGLQIGDDVLLFEGLDIRIHGQKFASPEMNQCIVQISNLTREQRNTVLTKASPMALNRTPIFMTVDIGRENSGTFRLFQGEVYAGGATEPPDISIILTSLTNSFMMGLIAANSQSGMVPLETIAQSIAAQNGLTLKFTAVKGNRMIANYSHTGAVGRQVEKLGLIGDVRAWVDNGVLNVCDVDGYADTNTFTLTEETGMVGVPQATQSGVMARMLASPDVNIGQRVAVKSVINPAVNGDSFFLSAISFDITNRDDPFFYNLTLTNQASYSNGTA